MSEHLDDLRRAFVDALARSFAEGVATLPDRADGTNEITEAIRDLAVSSQELTDALSTPDEVDEAQHER